MDTKAPDPDLLASGRRPAECEARDKAIMSMDAQLERESLHRLEAIFRGSPRLHGLIAKELRRVEGEGQ